MTTVTIAITKAKSTVEIDTTAIPEEVYLEALKLGLKDLMNRGMSKVTKSAYPDEADLKTEAAKIGATNLEAIMAGTIRMSSAKAKSAVSGEVKTEAMRLARAAVKDALKEQGYKISHYPASEITASAKELLSIDPSFIELAEKNLAERKALPTSSKINLAGLKADPKLVAAAEAKKKSKSEQLSATQAGIPKKRKGGAQANA